MGPANSEDEGSSSEGTSPYIRLPLHATSRSCFTSFAGSSSRCDPSRVDVRTSLLRLSPPRSTPPHLQQSSNRRNLVGRSSSVPISLQLSPHFLCVRLLLSSAFILRFVTDHRLFLVRRYFPFSPPLVVQPPHVSSHDLHALLTNSLPDPALKDDKARRVSFQNGRRSRIDTTSRGRGGYRY